MCHCLQIGRVDCLLTSHLMHSACMQDSKMPGQLCARFALNLAAESDSAAQNLTAVCVPQGRREGMALTLQPRRHRWLELCRLDLPGTPTAKQRITSLRDIDMLHDQSLLFCLSRVP